jgi:predicted AAA+ superfamily ATPase
LDNTGLIKVLVGQRRVGKSYLMKQLIDFLQHTKKVQPSNIVYINLEVEYLTYPTVQALDAYIQQRITAIKNHTRLYLFVDEIQELS